MDLCAECFGAEVEHIAALRRLARAADDVAPAFLPDDERELLWELIEGLEGLAEQSKAARDRHLRAKRRRGTLRLLKGGGS